jgi:hypothetical protein
MCPVIHEQMIVLTILRLLINSVSNKKLLWLFFAYTCQCFRALSQSLHKTVCTV